MVEYHWCLPCCAHVVLLFVLSNPKLLSSRNDIWCLQDALARKPLQLGTANQKGAPGWHGKVCALSVASLCRCRSRWSNSLNKQPTTQAKGSQVTGGDVPLSSARRWPNMVSHPQIGVPKADFQESSEDENCNNSNHLSVQQRASGDEDWRAGARRVEATARGADGPRGDGAPGGVARLSERHVSAPAASDAANADANSNTDTGSCSDADTDSDYESEPGGAAEASSARAGKTGAWAARRGAASNHRAWRAGVESNRHTQPFA